MKILAIINIIFWAIFIFVDKAWNNVLAEAVSSGQKTYGELYGPLSFFRPAILYGALLLTTILSGIIIITRKKIKSG